MLDVFIAAYKQYLSVFTNRFDMRVHLYREKNNVGMLQDEFNVTLNVFNEF